MDDVCLFVFWTMARRVGAKQAVYCSSTGLGSTGTERKRETGYVQNSILASTISGVCSIYVVNSVQIP